jgi:hypothetical protein
MIRQPPEQMTDDKWVVLPGNVSCRICHLSFVICHFDGYRAFNHLPRLIMVQCMAFIGYDSGRFRQLN